MNFLSTNQPNQINIIQQPIETGNSNQQSIQLLPLNNIQMLGNIRNIFQTNYTPISIPSFDNNMNTNNENVVKNLPNETINSTNPSSLHRSTSVSSDTQKRNLNQNQQQQIKPVNICNQQINGQPLKVDNMETQSNNVAKTTGIDEMNLNELKDECRRRKLLVTGNKQKLVDRIKSNINSTHINGIKSPDSGVNLDSSPSILSSKYFLII